MEPCAVPASLANVSMTKTLVGTYDSVRNEIPDRHFDLVVCNDVIEPLQNSMSDRNQDVSKAAGTAFDNVFHGMKQWRETRVNNLVSEYAKKIAPLDYEKGEKKLRALIEQHDSQEKEKVK